MDTRIKAYELSLKNNSIIIVPTVRETIGIRGNVNRPGIYEISGYNQNIQDLIEISGGLKLPGQNKYALQSLDDNGLDTFRTITNKKSTLKNGDILIVNLKSSIMQSKVKLKGAISYPTSYPIDNYSFLSDIIKDESVFRNNSYKYSVILKTTNTKNKSESFSIKNVKSSNDTKLKNNDEIIILSNKDLEFLNSGDVKKITEGISSNLEINKCVSLKFLKNYIDLDSNQKLNVENLVNETFDLDNVKSIASTKASKPNLITCPEIYEKNPQLLTFLIKNKILIRGNVERPGVYIAEKNSSRNKLVEYAGYKGGEILSSYDNSIIDIIKDSIIINGPFRFSEEVKISKGTKLSQILNNAQIVSQETYPFGYINRRDHSSGVTKTLTFNLNDIFTQRKDINLKVSDEITVFQMKKY